MNSVGENTGLNKQIFNKSLQSYPVVIIPTVTQTLAFDVLYLSEIKTTLNNKLLSQKRLKLFKSIMKFMEVRVDLDLQGWGEIDIFAHK